VRERRRPLVAFSSSKGYTKGAVESRGIPAWGEEFAARVCDLAARAFDRARASDLEQAELA
jgi:hypothetical protein